MTTRDDRDASGRLADYLREEFDVDETLTRGDYSTKGTIFIVDGTETYNDRGSQTITVVGAIPVGQNKTGETSGITKLRLDLLDYMRRRDDDGLRLSPATPYSHYVRIGDLPLNGRGNMKQADMVVIDCTTTIRS